MGIILFDKYTAVFCSRIAPLLPVYWESHTNWLKNLRWGGTSCCVIPDTVTALIMSGILLPVYRELQARINRVLHKWGGLPTSAALSH
ncbi:hypothetical protein FKM82_005678 [Ascaphus truei]